MQAVLCPDNSIELTMPTGGTKRIPTSHRAHPALLLLYYSSSLDPGDSSPGVFEDGFQLSAGYGGHPWKGGEPDPETVYEIPSEHIHVEPDRFQYKRGHDGDSGVVGELNDEAFDPERMGTLSVWKDKKTGKTCLVDGHHRFQLAKKAGLTTIPCRYIEARSAEEAKAIGREMNGHRDKSHLALSGGLFDESLHPRGQPGNAGQFTHKPIAAEHVTSAKKAFAGGKLQIKHASEPVESAASGSMIKHHVTLESGQNVHPDELHRLKIDDGETVLHHDEGLTIHDPQGNGRATSFREALGKVSAFKGKPDEPVTIVSRHGYSATRPRKEWMDQGYPRSGPFSFSEWFDSEGHQHTGRRVEHQGGAKTAGEGETADYFAQRQHGGKRLEFDTPAADKPAQAMNPRPEPEPEREPGDEAALTRAKPLRRAETEHVPFSAADPDVSADVRAEALRALREMFPLSAYDG